MSNHILWLAGWYPNMLSPLDGDFIQRHAKAVSLLNKVTVIFVKKDTGGIITKDVKKDVIITDNLTEIIVYYHPWKSGVKLIDRFLSKKKYNNIYRTILKQYIDENNVPDIVHIHVALNVEWQALWLKKKYSIPLLVSEHWSGYLAEAKPNLKDYNLLYKYGLQILFKLADEITVVSKVLGEALTEKFQIKNYHVIPNVVDTEIFFPAQKQPSPVTKFIHVSLLNYQKNFNDIIEAFYLINKKGYNFQLTVYGPASFQLTQQVKNLDLRDKIIFKNEVPQTLLAKDMQQADALILFSRYETFGCVVIEANACGLPAILSDIPVFKEYVIENETGMFAKSGDPKDLAAALINFINKKNFFSQTKIASYAKRKFSYQIVAEQFNGLYKSILNKSC
jgi:glycosyltransferase involved in cell wall biosynthesis